MIWLVDMVCVVSGCLLGVIIRCRRAFSEQPGDVLADTTGDSGRLTNFAPPGCQPYLTKMVLQRAAFYGTRGLLTNPAFRGPPGEGGIRPSAPLVRDHGGIPLWPFLGPGISLESQKGREKPRGFHLVHLPFRPPFVTFPKPFEPSPNTFSRPPTVFSRPPTVFPRPPKVLLRPPKVFSRPPTVFLRPLTVFSRRSTVLSRPSTVLSRPSTVFLRPPTVFLRPPTVFSRPSKVFSRPPTVFLRPLTVFSRPSTVLSRPSTVLPRPAKVFEKPHNGGWGNGPTSRGGRKWPGPDAG